MSRRLSAWRDRRAAARLLGRLFTEHTSHDPKSDDELTIEAWLWQVHGDPAVARRVRETRVGSPS